MISVITPTNRKESLKSVKNALLRQSYTDFEWIIGSPTKPDLDFQFTWIQDPPKKEGDYWAIYQTYNACLRVAKGDLIVSIQDNTFFDPDGLEKFAYYYENNPTSLVSGVGDKYTDDTWSVKTWVDPRIKGQAFRECNVNEIEWNYCSVPKEAIYKVGGFDEYLDKYSSLCGLDVGVRIDLLGGYKFYLDETNHSYSLTHPRYDGWDENTPFNGVWERKQREYRENPVLNYL